MAVIYISKCKFCKPFNGGYKRKRRGASRAITTSPEAIVIIILLFHRKVIRRIYNNNTRCIGRPRESFAVFQSKLQKFSSTAFTSKHRMVIYGRLPKKMSAKYKAQVKQTVKQLSKSKPKLTCQFGKFKVCKNEQAIFGHYFYFATNSFSRHLPISQPVI